MRRVEGKEKWRRKRGTVSGEVGEKKRECIHGEGGECVVSVVCVDQVHIEACEWIVPRPSLKLLSLAVQKQQKRV